MKAQVRGRDVLLETPAEIIAQKIYYRGGAMQPRDMFDIACVEGFSDIPHLAQAMTIELLETICTNAKPGM